MAANQFQPPCEKERDETNSFPGRTQLACLLLLPLTCRAFIVDSRVASFPPVPFSIARVINDVRQTSNPAGCLVTGVLGDLAVVTFPIGRNPRATPLIFQEISDGKNASKIAFGKELGSWGFLPWQMSKSSSLARVLWFHTMSCCNPAKNERVRREGWEHDFSYRCLHSSGRVPVIWRRRRNRVCKELRIAQNWRERKRGGRCDHEKEDSWKQEKRVLNSFIVKQNEVWRVASPIVRTFFLIESLRMEDRKQNLGFLPDPTSGRIRSLSPLQHSFLFHTEEPPSHKRIDKIRPQHSFILDGIEKTSQETAYFSTFAPSLKDIFRRLPHDYVLKSFLPRR